MARQLYAATPADYVIDAATGLPKSGVTVTVYTAVTGGTQVTDLLTAAGGAITTVTSDASGGFRFQGPDEMNDTLWVSVAGGTRFAVNVADMGSRLGALRVKDLADVAGIDVASPGDTLAYYNQTWTPIALPPDLSPGVWADVTLGAALTADATYFPLQVRQEAGQEVRLTGRATAATYSNNDTLFTIPAGFRPARAVTCRVQISGNAAPVIINTNGTVQAQSSQTSPGFISMDVCYSQIVPTVVEPPPADMMPTVRATSTAATGAAASTLNITLPAGIIGGDYIIIACSTRASAPTWTAPAGFSEIAHANPGGGAPGDVILYGKVAAGTTGAASSDASASKTASHDGTATSLEMIAVVISEGTYNATILDTATSPLWTNGTSATPGLLTVTTTHDKARVLSFVAQNVSNVNGTTWSGTPTGWTAVTNVTGIGTSVSQKFGVFSYPQDTAGATPSTSFTSALSTNWYSLTFPARAGGSAGGVITTPIREWAAGTWILDQVESVQEVIDTSAAVDDALALTGCTGYSVRVKWNLLEPTAGNYDFAILDEARTQHPTAKLAIRFMAGVHTPSTYKGYSWSLTSDGSNTYPCPFNDPNGADAATVGNVSFAPAYYNLVEQLAAWARADGNCRILHCSGYGYKWAEINALDLGPPVAGLRAKAGFTEAKWLSGHEALYASVLNDFIGSDLTLEFPASGSDLNGMGSTLYNWVGTNYPVDQVMAQINNIGGPYSVGRVSAKMTLGGQAYATTGAAQSKTWAQYYDQCRTLGLLYVETYRESFTEAAQNTAMAAWDPLSPDLVLPVT